MCVHTHTYVYIFVHKIYVYIKTKSFIKFILYVDKKIKLYKNSNSIKFTILMLHSFSFETSKALPTLLNL